MKKRMISLVLSIAMLLIVVLPTDIVVDAGTMSTSQDGVNLIKSFEGCKLKAYKALDTEKYYTIGYGHYGSDVYAGMTITQEQAEQMLKNDLKKYEGYVNTFLNNNSITVTQNQFDALVSFTYNLGNVWVSTPTFQLKTILCDGVSKYSDSQITTAFTNWNKSGGKVVNGLTDRRKKEAEYFLSNRSKNEPKDLGTDFYAYIINTDCWKGLTNDFDNVCFIAIQQISKTHHTS